MADWKLAAVLFLALFVSSLEGQGQASALSETSKEAANALVEVERSVNDFDDDDVDQDDFANSVEGPLKTFVERHLRLQRNKEDKKDKEKPSTFREGVEKVVEKAKEIIEAAHEAAKTVETAQTLASVGKAVVDVVKNVGRVRGKRDTDKAVHIDAANCEAGKTATIQDLRQTLVRLASVIDVLELQDCEVVGTVESSADTAATTTPSP